VTSHLLWQMNAINSLSEKSEDCIAMSFNCNSREKISSSLPCSNCGVPSRFVWCWRFKQTSADGFVKSCCENCFSCFKRCRDARIVSILSVTDVAGVGAKALKEGLTPKA